MVSVRRFEEDESSKRDMKVCGVVRDDGACGFYRIVSPLEKMQLYGYANVALGGVGRDANLFETMEDADIIIMPRASGEANFKTIQMCQKAGKKVIIDHDDDVFNVNPLSPHYISYGTDEVEVEIDGERIKLWEDGRENKGQVFDLKANVEKMEYAGKCLEICDGISVTTEELAKVYRKFNSDVYVLPNCIDFDIWKPLPLPKTSQTSIIWSGGASHYHDWLTVVPTLVDMLKDNKKLKFIACGHEFSGLVNEIPKGQYEFHRWVPTPAHPYKQAILNPDIAIIPLEKDTFNAGKSPIKFIEHAALKVPSLCANWLPYSAEIEDGVNGFLYNDTFEFAEKLKLLIENPELRWEMGQNAYDYALKNYDIHSQCYRWAEVYHKTLEGKLVTI